MKRVLIANRGEIAVRIARACAAEGIETIAVHSEADADALHVRTADRAVCLGGPAPGDSYLNVPALLAAAAEHGADAVHPGYGFLSENASFARAVGAAGMVWIGPPPAAIDSMGSKIEARRTMEAAGVPVVPGAHDAGQDTRDLVAVADAIGFPLLVKASAGGGGKGMRAVHRREELVAAVDGARREATQAFGDGTVYLEKLLIEPRHVELQVFADAHGEAVHLYERECSIQRRHQKILEESPSTAVDPALRARMGAAAVDAAKAVGYVGAGTVEFLLDAAGEFYFLEMNTRLQVEHPVTEMILGVDLVRAQLAVARGEPLPWRQEDIVARGHAIEVRLYAEDPARDFLPATGRLLRYRPPAGPGVRHDGGIAEGDEVSVHYDPMLAKLIVWGEDRAAAAGRLRAALASWEVHGVVTNLAFLQAVARHPAYLAGETHTGFIPQHFPDPAALATPAPDEAFVALAVAGQIAAGAPSAAGPRGGSRGGDWVSPWTRLGAWRLPND